MRKEREYIQQRDGASDGDCQATVHRMGNGNDNAKR